MTRMSLGLNKCMVSTSELSPTIEDDVANPSFTSVESRLGAHVARRSSQRCNSAGCRENTYSNLNVCAKCQHHFPMRASERVEQLLDPGTFVECCANLQASDPLQFNDGRSYIELIRAEQKKTGLQEAVIVGQGLMKGIQVVLGVLDSGFIG